MVADKVTRFSADLLVSAMAEGQRQSRTGRQQLEHWARTQPHDGASRRPSLADSPVTEFGAGEGTVFNAEISAAIEERGASTSLSDRTQPCTTTASSKAHE